MIIGFSGHRHIDANKLNCITASIKNILISLKPKKAISGMALGLDTIAAEICIELKIPFIAAVPFLGQEVLWSKEDKEKYRDLLDQAEDVVIVSPGAYSAWKLHKRNEYIVDNSDQMLVYYDGRSGGGTKSFINYCTKKNKPIEYVKC